MASLERSGRYHAALSRGYRLLQTPVARLGFGLALSSLCLYLAIQEVAFAEIVRLLSGARFAFICLALVVVSANILVKILRWEILLGPQVCQGNHWRISGAFLSAQLLNAALPFRAGEVGRVIAMAGSSAVTRICR